MRKRRVVGVITARTHFIVQDSNLLLLISLGVRVRSLNSSSRGFRFSPQHKLKCATQYQQHVPRHRLRLLVQRFGQAWSGPVWSASQRGHRCGYSLHIIYNTNYHNHHHQSLNLEGRWGTTDDFATSFLHFSLFSTALWDLPNSRPVHYLMLSSHLVLCLPRLFPFSLCLARWFWPDLMNGKHDHTTAVCVSLRSSGLRVVQLPARSWHGLPHTN